MLENKKLNPKFWTRRSFLATIPLLFTNCSSTSNAKEKASFQHPAHNIKKETMRIRGINYDTGTEYVKGDNTRLIWNQTDIKRDMKVIKNELFCNSVNLYGSSIDRLIETANIALGAGLSVSIQARLIDGNKKQMLDYLKLTAIESEKLKSKGDVILNTGCELTLFTSGFLPGKTFLDRMQNLIWSWPALAIFYSSWIDHLTEMSDVSRSFFSGPITYSAGVWEDVDWNKFDYIGVNLYRDRDNEFSYVSDLKNLQSIGKPVIITEFGCCTFEGAERLGGGGWLVVDHSKIPPEIKEGYKRNEKVQAEHLAELLDLYYKENIHGCFIFDFLESGNVYNPENPKFDLDMASYGIVKALPPSSKDRLHWEKKLAFQTVAERYQSFSLGSLHPKS
ncbi:hypothetical protein P3G55_13285 [Leptospira sp. 96542]|nr:hypothetical protein [Leptospira sp. 96542]